MSKEAVVFGISTSLISFLGNFLFDFYIGVIMGLCFVGGMLVSALLDI